MTNDYMTPGASLGGGGKNGTREASSQMPGNVSMNCAMIINDLDCFLMHLRRCLVTRRWLLIIRSLFLVVMKVHRTSTVTGHPWRGLAGGRFGSCLKTKDWQAISCACWGYNILQSKWSQLPPLLLGPRPSDGRVVYGLETTGVVAYQQAPSPWCLMPKEPETNIRTVVTFDCANLKLSECFVPQSCTECVHMP